MKLKIINNDEHSTHVALSGRFDCEGVAEVFEDFKRNVTDRKLPAILDMTEMDFISSLGLRTLQVAAQELKTHGAKLVLYNPQPFVAGELAAAGFAQSCPITNDLGEAMRLVAPQSCPGGETLWNSAH